MSDSRANAPLASGPKDFVDAMLALKPDLAVFDCDGTLWSGDGGQDFFYWEISQNLIPPQVIAWALPRYAEYREGKVEEAQMCGEMVTIHAGLPVAVIEQATERFFLEVLEPRIFLEMQMLTRQLIRSGCEVWAVSSTNEWVIAEAVRRFGISKERVLAASVYVDDGRATDRLILVPTDDDKAQAIRKHIGRKPDLVFGNSIHDAAMLEVATRALVINPNPDLERLAKRRQWSVYWPEAILRTAGGEG